MAIKLWTEKIKKLIYSVAKMNKYWDKFYLPDFRHLVLELQQQDIKGGDLSTDQQSAELSAVKISISAWSFWLILLCRIMLPLSHCWSLSNIFLLTLFMPQDCLQRIEEACNKHVNSVYLYLCSLAGVKIYQLL